MLYHILYAKVRRRSTSEAIRFECWRLKLSTERPARPLASSRQVTRIGESVFRNGRISQGAIDFSCNVLSQMATEYKAVGVVGVRALGTSALRDAGNREEFLERASAALQAPVEVISGQEEARLIHLGVQNRLASSG